MKHFFFFFVPLLLVCTWIGCGKPDDLPPLASFQVKVTKAGTPAEGVVIFVYSEKLPSRYDCYGISNASGSLTLNAFDTTGKKTYTGAPVGPIRIGARRPGDFGLEDPRVATKGMSREESYAYAAERSKKIVENEKFVPLSLSDPLISPIEFTIVEKESNELTIELDDPKWDVKIDPKRLKSR